MSVRSQLPAGEVGVVRQVVDQLADHETVVELGRHGDVTSAALSRVGPGQRRRRTSERHSPSTADTPSRPAATGVLAIPAWTSRTGSPRASH